MSNAAGKLPDGFHLLRMVQGLASLFQGELGFPPLGKVPGDFCVAHQVLRRVADRIDDDAGPKAGPVLAYPPALALELAFARRRREGFRRQSRLPVLLGVEPREVLPEDFSLLNPLKRRAPGFQLVTMPLTSIM
jgi:hypothetical protein